MAVVRGSGDLSLQFLSYSYADCKDYNDCDFVFRDFNLSIANTSLLYKDKITLPANTNVVNLTQLDYFQCPFNFNFTSLASLNISLSVYEEDTGEDFVESISRIENLGDKHERIWYHGNATGGKGIISYEVLVICDPHFQGMGCGDCKGKWGGINCDICKGNWKEPGCETCDIGWAGEGCDTCDINYYPAGNCSELCIPTLGMSTCDDQGMLVCGPHVTGDNCDICEVGWNGTRYLTSNREPTDTSKQPIRTRYLGHVTGYQPIRDQYFLIRSVSWYHQP
eukprot:sb/3467901/